MYIASQIFQKAKRYIDTSVLNVRFAVSLFQKRINVQNWNLTHFQFKAKRMQRKIVVQKAYL
jgi:hypothetical protein